MKKLTKESTRSMLLTLKKAFVHLQSESRYIAYSVALAAVTVASTLTLPILVGQVIDAVIGENNVDFPRIGKLLLGIALVAVTGAVAQWLVTLCGNRLSYHVIHDIRKNAFAHLQTLPLSYIDSHSAGDTVNRLHSDADTFADGLLIGFTQLFTGVATILGTLILMATIQPIIALVVVVITPLSLFVSRFIASHTHDMFKEQSEIRGEQTGFMNEVIAGQKTVKAFGREKEMIDRFSSIAERLRKASLRATFFSSLTNPSTRFVNSVVYAAVAVSGALIAVAEQPVFGIGMTVGTLSCFLSYANQYTKPFNEIAGVVTELQNACACAERIFELCDAPSEPTSPADAVCLTAVVGNVALQDVSFSYVPEKPLLRHISLSVNAGQRIAIIGPTGCGKTTLINLLMRFYDVNQGKITVDGFDIREITRDSLRAAYGMVLQETWLSNATVKENISFGRQDATDSEIVAAAEKAHADAFIRRLPEGYHTVIGDGGTTLSEGQKQLLCIARVMLSLPPILILDEATSSLDTRTEMQVQNAFKTLMEGRTSFIVAHRLSTVKEADCILVMKDGNIIEKGSHAELLRQNGFYAELYCSRFEKQEQI